MPALVAALPVILAATTVATTAVTVEESVKAGQQAQAAANYKAKQLQQQALQAQQEAGLQLAAQDQKSTALLASIRANAAASGVVPGAGSALELADTSSEQAQLNEMYTKYAGNLQAQGINTEANLTTYGGKNAKTAAYISAGGDLAAGLGSLAKIGLYTQGLKTPTKSTGFTIN